MAAESWDDEVIWFLLSKVIRAEDIQHVVGVGSSTEDGWSERRCTGRFRSRFVVHDGSICGERSKSSSIGAMLTAERVCGGNHAVERG